MPDQLQPTILLDIAHIAIPWLATLTAVTNLKCCDFDYMSSHSFLTEMNAILGFVLVVSLLLALILYFPSNNNINTTGSVSTITLVVSALLWRTFSIALSMNVALLITPPNRVNELWSTPHPVEACERALLAYSLKTLRLFLCLRVVGEMVGGGQFVYRWINVRRSSESDPVKSIEEVRLKRRSGDLVKKIYV